MTQTSFKEKLKGEGYPKVSPIPPKMAKRLGEGTLLIPAPWEVDELMRGVPEGKLITVVEIREALCAKHGTNQACAIVTGISVGVAAGAAEEDLAAGAADVTPYWRTLKKGGELNAKLPGGAAGQKARLEAEGHVVAQRGRRLVVEGYEDALVRP